jgi:DNA-binding transcriptional LysR family regulator
VQIALVLPILEELMRAIPGFSMQLHSADEEAMVEGLLDGELDLAVRAHDSAPDRHPFHHLPLITERLTVVCAPTHALANTGMIDVQSLLNATDRISFCKTAERQLGALGPSQPPRHRADTPEQISQMIQIGAGWALLPADSSIAANNARIDVVGADVCRMIEVVYPAGRPHGVAMSTFLRLARMGKRPAPVTSA